MKKKRHEELTKERDKKEENVAKANKRFHNKLNRKFKESKFFFF